MRMLCVKGRGKDHAKFSPVGERSGLRQPSGLVRKGMLVPSSLSLSSYSLLSPPP